MALNRIDLYPILPKYALDSDDDPHGLGPLKAGWMDAVTDRRVTINDLIAQNKVPVGVKVYLQMVGWDGAPLTEHEIHQLHQRGLGLLIEAGLDLPAPAPQPEQVVPMTRDQVRKVMQSHGHPDSPFDRKVEERWNQYRLLPRFQGETALRRAMEGEARYDTGVGYFELPPDVNRSPSVDPAFDALEEAFVFATAHQESINEAYAAKLKLLFADLKTAIASSQPAGVTFDPRFVTSLVQASERALCGPFTDRAAIIRTLNAIYSGVPQIGRVLRDDDPKISERPFDTNPVFR